VQETSISSMTLADVTVWKGVLCASTMPNPNTITLRHN